MKNKGFTLMEILVVIAIIGILATIFLWNFIPSYRKSQLSEAAASVSATLNRARSESQKTSRSQPLVWSSDTLQGQQLPNGATIATSYMAGIAYSAPYAELVGTSDGQRLELVDSSGQYHTAVDLVGVTGKVVRRGVVPIAMPIP